MNCMMMSKIKTKASRFSVEKAAGFASNQGTTNSKPT
jgi:hypothetical protein